MSNMDQARMLITNLTMQLPVILVCIAGCAVTVMRWQQAPKAAVWAISGFGLALAVSILMPVAQVSIQSWALENGGPARMSKLLSAFSFLWALLRAGSYALLIVGVFAGRSQRRLSA